MYYGNLLERQIQNERKKKRLVIYTLFSLLCIYLLFNLLLDNMGIIKFLDLRETEQRLIMEISSLRKENASTEREIELLKRNPFYLEKHARENLNLAGPDEYIFLYE